MNNQVIGSIILESANEAAEVNIISEHNGKPEATGIIQTLFSYLCRNCDRMLLFETKHPAASS